MRACEKGDEADDEGHVVGNDFAVPTVAFSGEMPTRPAAVRANARVLSVAALIQGQSASKLNADTLLYRSPVILTGVRLRSMTNHIPVLRKLDRFLLSRFS